MCRREIQRKDESTTNTLRMLQTAREGGHRIQAFFAQSATVWTRNIAKGRIKFFTKSFRPAGHILPTTA